MTEQERAARGRNAHRALEEFLDPAFAAVIDSYSVRLKEIAAKEPWQAGKIIALANATRIAEEVRSQIRAIAIDGEEARRRIERERKIESLTPARRRLLNIGAR